MTLLISLFVLSILIAHSAASTCGGNCPSGKCPSCPCGTTPSKVDVATWCSKYSWNQAACQCIMNAESVGNSNAMNYNSDGSFDVGLWLVNNYNWNACSGGSAPCGASANLQCGKSPLRQMLSIILFLLVSVDIAIDVYNWGGRTWKFWSTCAKCGVCNSN